MRDSGTPGTRLPPREDQVVQDAARQVFINCAPERESDVEDMWRDLEPIFQLEPNDQTGHFALQAGLYRFVRFQESTFRAFWIAGYCFWEGYEITTNASRDTARLKALIDTLERVLKSSDPDSERLPEGVNQFGSYPEREVDAKGCLATELATFAVGWALLHELQHIRNQRDGTAAARDDRVALHGEELACDAFATKFLLDKVDEYASDSVSVDEVRRKRQMGVFVALFALTLITKNRWGLTETHPCIIDRFSSVINAMKPVDGEAKYVGYAAFDALRKVWPCAPSPYTKYGCTIYTTPNIKK